MDASNLMGWPLVLAVLAVVVVAGLMSRRGKRSPEKPSAATTLPALELPGNEPLRDMVGIAYLLHHDTGTSNGLSKTARNWLRYSGWIDLGRLAETSSHISINLRNRTDLRDHDRLPNGPFAPTLGHGIIIGVMGAGQPNYGEDAPQVFSAVVEQFDKTEGLRTLLPETQSPALPRRVWVSVVSARDGERMTLRYIVVGEGVQFDSGDVVTEHSQPLDGDDCTRALFPFVDCNVRHEPAEVLWSGEPLVPLAPMASTDL